MTRSPLDVMEAVRERMLACVEGDGSKLAVYFDEGTGSIFSNAAFISNGAADVALAADGMAELTPFVRTKTGMLSANFTPEYIAELVSETAKNDISYIYNDPSEIYFFEAAAIVRAKKMLKTPFSDPDGADPDALLAVKHLYGLAKRSSGAIAALSQALSRRLDRALDMRKRPNDDAIAWALTLALERVIADMK